jgi:predicted Fe-S protein YdhL (DUF1289 family)
VTNIAKTVRGYDMQHFNPKKLNNNQFSSPCVGTCCLDTNDICLGCFRSLEEITRWTLVNEQTRQDFLANAKDRAQRHQKT